MNFCLHLSRGVWGLASRLDQPCVKRPLFQKECQKSTQVINSGHQLRSHCKVPSEIKSLQIWDPKQVQSQPQSGPKFMNVNAVVVMNCNANSSVEQTCPHVAVIYSLVLLISADNPFLELNHYGFP